MDQYDLCCETISFAPLLAPAFKSQFIKDKAVEASIEAQLGFAADAALLRKMLIQETFPAISEKAELENSLKHLSNVEKLRANMTGAMVDKLKSFFERLKKRLDVSALAPPVAETKMESYKNTARSLMETVGECGHNSDCIDAKTSVSVKELVDKHHTMQQLAQYMKNSAEADKGIAFCRGIADCVARDVIRKAVKAAAVALETLDAHKPFPAKMVSPLANQSFKALLVACKGLLGKDEEQPGTKLKETIVKMFPEMQVPAVGSFVAYLVSQLTEVADMSGSIFP